MATRNKITIIILAIITILAGVFFLWYFLTVDSENPIEIIMDQRVFTDDENIAFTIKNNSLSSYCFSDNFSDSSLNIDLRGGYMYSFKLLQKNDSSEWVKTERPSEWTASEYFNEEYGIYYPVATGGRVQRYNVKINPFGQKNYELRKTATFSQGKLSYTWELPAGEYKLLIYYGQCQKKSLFGDEARTEYYNSLKTVYSPTFEIK